MKAISNGFLDFAKGITLIGGCPLLVCFVIGYISLKVDDLLAKNGHENGLSKFDALFNVAFFVSATIAFAFAVRYRIKHRTLPLPFVGWEIILGLLGAVIIFFVLVMHFARIC